MVSLKLIKYRKSLKKIINIRLINYKLISGIYINYEYINKYTIITPYSKEEISIYKNNFQFKDQIKQYKHFPFKFNLKYFIRYIRFKKVIEIIIFGKNKNDCMNIQMGDLIIDEIEFSPFYSDIFATVSCKELKIWKISEKEKKIEDKSSIVLLDNVYEIFLS